MQPGRRPTAETRRAAWRAGIVFLVLLAGTSHAPGQRKEFALKAQMLCKMLPYITWPKGTFKKPTTAITIGILGKDPFGSIIERACKRTKVKNRKVRVVRFPTWKLTEKDKRVFNCHVLFVTATEKKSLSKICKAMAKRPILLFSDSKGFARAGTHINFFLSKSKVAFETNAKSARRAGLKLSSMILRLGRQIQ